MAAGPGVPLGPSVCICVHLWSNHFHVRLSTSRVRKRSGSEKRAAARNLLTAKRPAMLQVRAGPVMSARRRTRNGGSRNTAQGCRSGALRRHRVQPDPGGNLSDTGATVG